MGKPAATARPCLRSLSHSFTLDFVVFGDDKRTLWQVKEAMATYLTGLRLRLHATKCQVLRTQDGIDFLGYRIFPTHRRLRQTTARRFIRRLRLQSKLYSGGMLSLPCIDRSVQSWLGHATHTATYGLRRNVFNAIAFRRTPVSADSTGEGQAEPGRPARRRVEQ
jgi:RNA-directed DNA polymerase